MIVIESQLTKWTYIKIHMFLSSKALLAEILLLAIFFAFPLHFLTHASLIPSVLLLGLLILYRVYTIYFYSRSTLNRNFFHPVTYVFEDDSISITSPIGEDTTKWEAIVKWKKIAGHYLLYINIGAFYAIPESALTQDEVVEFESLIKSKVKKPKNVEEEEKAKEEKEELATDTNIVVLLDALQGYEPALSNYMNMPMPIKRTYANEYVGAKNEETKAKRLQQIIDRLNENRKLL